MPDLEEVFKRLRLDNILRPPIKITGYGGGTMNIPPSGTYPREEGKPRSPFGVGPEISGRPDFDVMGPSIIPPGDSGPNMPNGPVGQMPSDDPNAPVRPNISEDTLEELRRIIQEGPQYKDPKVWQKILAVAGGALMGDPSTVSDIVEGPRKRATEEWKNKVEGLGKISDIEAKQRQHQEDMTREERLAKSAEALEAYRNESNDIRMKIAEMQAQGREDAAKATLERMREIEGLRRDGRLDVLEATQAMRETLARLQGDLTAAQIAQRAAEARETKQTPGAAAVNEKTRVATKASEIKNRMPDLSPFITIAEDGTVTVKEPGSKGGPSYDDHKHIQSMLYGAGRTGDIELPSSKPAISSNGATGSGGTTSALSQPAAAKPTSNSTPSAAMQQYPPKPGYVILLDTRTGKAGYVPEAEEEAALKKPYYVRVKAR